MSRPIPQDVAETIANVYGYDEVIILTRNSHTHDSYVVQHNTFFDSSDRLLEYIKTKVLKVVTLARKG